MDLNFRQICYCHYHLHRYLNQRSQDQYNQLNPFQSFIFANQAQQFHQLLSITAFHILLQLQFLLQILIANRRRQHLLIHFLCMLILHLFIYIIIQVFYIQVSIFHIHYFPFPLIIALILNELKLAHFQVSHMLFSALHFSFLIIF